jgi:hypothetical protein
MSTVHGIALAALVVLVAVLVLGVHEALNGLAVVHAQLNQISPGGG